MQQRGCRKPSVTSPGGKTARSGPWTPFAGSRPHLGNLGFQLVQKTPTIHASSVGIWGLAANDGKEVATRASKRSHGRSPRPMGGRRRGASFAMGFETCWICGAPATTGEHKTKLSDLKAVLGKPTQQQPVYETQNDTSMVLEKAARTCRRRCGKSRMPPDTSHCSFEHRVEHRREVARR